MRQTAKAVPRFQLVRDVVHSTVYIAARNVDCFALDATFAHITVGLADSVKISIQSGVSRVELS